MGWYCDGRSAGTGDGDDGAFLLTDWLSAPETLWVILPMGGRNSPFAFTRDGRVESRIDKGSVFGSWWLEAENLSVSFGKLGIQSWPWQEAAENASTRPGAQFSRRREGAAPPSVGL